MVIGVGSVGVDMVDVDAATAAGIVVTNVPDVFIEEVADHAMMLLLDVARRTPRWRAWRARVEWYEARPMLSRVPRLLGQTLGLFAFGNVARCTARRAKAFGMRVIAYDPYVSELEITAAGVEPVELRRALGAQRLPLDPRAAQRGDRARHRRRRAGADEADGGVVNTARGPIIDEAALIEALRDGVIAGAGLDVLEQEPPSPDNPLLDHGERAGDPARRLGHHPHAAGDAPPRRPRGGDGAARPLADELRQPDCAAARRRWSAGSPTR